MANKVDRIRTWYWQIEIASAHMAGRQVVIIRFAPGETEIACPWSSTSLHLDICHCFASSECKGIFSDT